MEMRILIGGAGLSFPGSGISLSIISGAYLQFRSSKNSPPTLYGVGSVASESAEGKTLLLSYVKTDWFFVDPVRDPWILQKQQLIGKKLDIKVSGTLTGSGRIDIRVVEIADDGDLTNLIKKDDIKATGIQLSDTSVRGLVKWFPSQAHQAAAERFGHLRPLHANGAMK